MGTIKKYYTEYTCDRCEEDLHTHDGCPYVKRGNKHYCYDCAFILGVINSETYIENGLYYDDSIYRAAVYNNKIYTVHFNELFPWERTNRQGRHCANNTTWRNEVFERDNYTCQKCNKRGGELNAHHIKSYSKFKELRYEVDNGITVCIECHRKIHKKVETGD